MHLGNSIVYSYLFDQKLLSEKMSKIVSIGAMDSPTKGQTTQGQTTQGQTTKGQKGDRGSNDTGSNDKGSNVTGSNGSVLVNDFWPPSYQFCT